MAGPGTRMNMAWLRDAARGIGLGLWAGALEGSVIAATIDLDPAFGSALLLMLCSTVLGALLGAGLGLLLAFLLRITTRWHGDYSFGTRVMSLVALALAAFHFWPLAWVFLHTQKPAASVAAVLLPLGFAGITFFNARYWLRKAWLGYEPRLGWNGFAAVVALALCLVNATWLVNRSHGAHGIALESDSNVLLVTIDTLRRDHVGIYDEEQAVPTPNFDAFARQGVLFKDAVTPMPETGPAHASLFTGLHPVRHGVLSNGHVLAAGYTTLAERLADEGYATAAFVSSFAVDSRTGLDQGFQIYDDDFFPAIHGFAEIRLVRLALRVIMRFWDPLKVPFLLERGAIETNRHAISWLAARGDRPFFCWVHYFEPHAPYETHGSSSAPPVDHRYILAHEDQVDYTPGLVASLRELYAGEVGYVDQRLGDLLNALDELGLDQDTMVIVTADHGEMLGEHGYYFNHHGIYDQAVRVPLAIRAPGTRPATREVDAQVRLMDIPATVLKYLNMDPMKHAEGVELLGYAQNLRHRSLAATLMGRKTASLERGTLYGLRTGRASADQGNALKYFYDQDDGSDHLFDLEADPHELRDLAPKQPELVEKSRRIALHEAQGASGKAPELDSSTREGLKALGYID